MHCLKKFHVFFTFFLLNLSHYNSLCFKTTVKRNKIVYLIPIRILENEFRKCFLIEKNMFDKTLTDKVLSNFRFFSLSSVQSMRCDI